MVFDIIESVKPYELHVIFSIASGMLLIIAGTYIISKNKENLASRLFSTFYAGLGLYQVFDGTYTFFFFISKDVNMANLMRDLSLASLVLGLNFGALSILVIYYGEDKVFQSQVLAGDAFLVVLMFLGILLGDHVSETAPKIRTELGWLAVDGAFVIFSAIIVATLLLLIQSAVSVVRARLAQLLAGYLIVVITLFAFDASFVFTFIQTDILSNPYLHFLMHLTALLGGALMLLTIIRGWK